ncbi:hypothetical protein EMB92_02710 [Bifidobacterium callitrichos]|uniref:Uncharacterized protein n=1 Tax=Bifidobacterium callitrichos TaxID=762209 RepID=A0A5M9ZEC2_9BIFI|nr:hypothetical protein [Bifidobacterium callitrichos]KAA8817490.1 hypothetical protein EMB92_02710 [Bifidobacterium callitrichos]
MTDVQDRTVTDDERDEHDERNGSQVDIVPLDAPGMRSPIEAPDFDELIRPVELKRRRPPLSAIIGTIVAVIAVVAVVVALIVLKPFSAVRASDYSTAAQQTSTMAKQYAATSAAVDDAFKFLYAQGVSYDASKEQTLKAQASKLGKSVDAFADLRAAKDPDVLAAYTVYATQAKHFVRLSENLADSAQPLSAMVTACGKTPSGTMYDADFITNYEQYIATCKAAVEPLDDAKAQVVSEFSSTLGQTLDQMTAIINQMKAIGDPSSYSSSSDQGKQLKDLSSQLVDLDTSYGALNTLQEQLRQSRENADPTALLDKLNVAIQQGYQHDGK